jgi:hypothetical protein
MGRLIRVCACASAKDDVDVDVAAAAVDAGRDFSVEVGVASVCWSYCCVGLPHLGRLMASKEAISWRPSSPQQPLLSHCRHARGADSVQIHPRTARTKQQKFIRKRYSETGTLTQHPLPQIRVASPL